MSVSQRADKRWVVKYKRDGKWVQRAFRDETEARAYDAEQADAEERRLSLGELTLVYLRSKPDMHIETRKRIAWLLADGGPAACLRDKYADMLNRADLERLREGLRIRNVSANTINKAQAYLRAILAFGVEQSFLSINPWRDFKRLKVQKYPMMASLDDLKKVYAYLSEPLQWAVKTAFYLSLRFGMVELFRLEWSAFDWQRGIVIVRQGKSGMLKTVVLRNQAYIDEAYSRYLDDTKKGIVYVCHRDGLPILSYKEGWKSACLKAGVKIRPYDVRHLSATAMLAAGGDLAAVAAQLGHKSVSTTGNTYAHVTPMGQAHAAGLLPSIAIEDSTK